MNYSEGQCAQRSRQPTLPPYSNRTLHHPSFLPMYMAAGFAQHHTDFNNQTVHPIIPAEFFYTDPTMMCGRRIPNIVSELRVFDCFQLNAPPPVMSACLAPPSRPDPFKSAPHPTRDLGSLTLKINTLHPQVHPTQVILQLTQEEDQAVTDLLKLHHQQLIQSEDTLTGPQMDISSVDLNSILFLHRELIDSTSAEGEHKPFCSDVQYLMEASLQSELEQGRCWSDRELEAANTLLSRFSWMEKDKIRGQNRNTSAVTLPDALPHQRHEDTSMSAETQQGSETLPPLITNDCTQNNVGCISFSHARENGEQGWGDLGFLEGEGNTDVHLPVRESSLFSNSKTKCSVSAAGDFSEVKERTLSDPEEDAVRVLLSLGDTGALDIMQRLS